MFGYRGDIVVSYVRCVRSNICYRFNFGWISNRLILRIEVSDVNSLYIRCPTKLKRSYETFQWNTQI